MKTVKATAFMTVVLSGLACSGVAGSRRELGQSDGSIAAADGSAAADADAQGIGAGADASEAAASDASESSSDAGDAAGASDAFVHPGLLHTQADFARMAEKVAAQESPWIDGWNRLIANSHASLSWTPHPLAEIHRNDGTNPDNSMTFADDVAAAYACALRWKVSGEKAYADKAVEILNAWSSTLTAITWSDGHYDGFLVAGIQGYQIANAAEIMRTYSGWAPADFSRFQAMMLSVFYPMLSGTFTTTSSVLVYSSWDLSAMAAALAIGVLCDDRAIFDAVIQYFKEGLGNGALPMTVYYMHPGYLGQTQESGRDQGHNTLSISLLTTLCEMAWNQGVDLYGYDNNRVLAAAEYVAKGNLIETGTTFFSVPFATYTNGSVVDTGFAMGSQGFVRPQWALVFHHYVNRKGLSAPYVQKFMELTAPEGGGGDYGPNSGGYDQLGYGTLTSSREPIARGAPPSGLTARVSEGRVALSWWGTAGATSYAVKRSATPGGPYETLASGITDPRAFTDAAPASAVAYYVVTATTPEGETAASNEAKAFTAGQLLARWAFDASSGASASDASGNGLAGTLVGGATWGDGKSGGAVALDGLSGFVDLPNDLMLDVADFTVAAWVYWSASSNNARVFDFGAGTGQYMMLMPRDGSGIARFSMTKNLGVGEQSIKAAGPLPTGRWVHVAVTLAGKVGTLYVDGAAVGQNTDLELAPFQLGPTSHDWIGRSQYAADPYFEGSIDDFRIYGGALTPEQVAAL